MFALTNKEQKILAKLKTPLKIQAFLDSLAINWEKRGETYMSPRRVLETGKAHCLEGAMLAGLALWLHGEPPLVLDLKTKGDDDHVVTLYKRNGYWGAISKTNHATLRWRDPVYKTVRELALSYFHEYFKNSTGKKVLRSFSQPINLKRFGTRWITSQEDLFYIADAIDRAPHVPILPRKNEKFLRPADAMEQKAGRIIEWPRTDTRT